jgi:hypothetical protein
MPPRRTSNRAVERHALVKADVLGLRKSRRRDTGQCRCLCRRLADAEEARQNARGSVAVLVVDRPESREPDLLA